MKLFNRFVAFVVVLVMVVGVVAVDAVRVSAEELAYVRSGGPHDVAPSAMTSLANFSGYNLRNVMFEFDFTFANDGGQANRSIVVELSDNNAIGIWFHADGGGPLQRFHFFHGTMADSRDGFGRTSANPQFNGVTALGSVSGTFPNAITAQNSTNRVRFEIELANNTIFATMQMAGVVNGVAQPFVGSLTAGRTTGTPSTVASTTYIRSFQARNQNRTLTIDSWTMYESAANFTPVGPVENVAAVPRADGRVDVSWDSADEATHYDISVNGTTVTGEAGLVAQPSDRQEFLLVSDEIVNGQPATVSVRPRNRWVLNAPFVDAPVFTSTLAAAANPQAIGGVRRADVSWTAPASGEATGYRVYRSFNGGEFLHPQTVTGLSLAEENLEPGSYRWRVVPFNYAGDSEVTPAETDAATVTEVQDLPSHAPENFTVGVGTSMTAVLSWDPVPYANNYRVYWRTTPDGTWQNSGDDGLGNVLTHTLTPLQNDTEYEFGVRPGNIVGWLGGTTDEGRATETATVYTLNTLGAETGTWFETIFAEWDARQIDVGDRPFEVYVRTAGTGNWILVNNPEVPVAGISWDNDHSALVREVSPGRWRADVPGLAGNYAYDLRIVANADGVTDITSNLTPPPFDRQGFAFYPGSPFGRTTGGYREDGTIRDWSLNNEQESAVVIYVNNANRNTFETPFGSARGINGLLSGTPAANRRGANTPLNQATPVVLRFMGTVDAPPTLSAYGGAHIRQTANITIEGIGHDALLNRWGFLNENSSNMEFRNLYIRPRTGGDGIFLQGGVHFDRPGGNQPPVINPAATGADVTAGMPANIWMHHLRFEANVGDVRLPLDGNAPWGAASGEEE